LAKNPPGPPSLLRTFGAFVEDGAVRVRSGELRDDGVHLPETPAAAWGEEAGAEEGTGNDGKIGRKNEV